MASRLEAERLDQALAFRIRTLLAALSTGKERDYAMAELPKLVEDWRSGIDREDARSIANALVTGKGKPEALIIFLRCLTGSPEIRAEHVFSIHFPRDALIAAATKKKELAVASALMRLK